MVPVIVIIVTVIMILLWLLLSPLIIITDTRVPCIKLRWISVGWVSLSYEDEWRLRFRVLFYKKELLLKNIKPHARKKKIKAGKEISNSRNGLSRLLEKTGRILQSFNVTELRIAPDTRDYCYNALLYPLNFILPPGHCNINFNNETYVLLRVRNRPLRIIWAWFK